MHPEFLDALRRLNENRRPYAMATVIRVDGSASARTGSKALFDEDGTIVSGWVGGGCAQTFIGEQSVEALAAHQPRTVVADLDDEIFGLGVACGGRMQVFVEPHYPPIQVAIPRPNPESRSEELEFLMETLGMQPQWTEGSFAARDLGALMLRLATSVADSRGVSARSLRDVRDLPVTFAPVTFARPRRAFLVGQSRITETLARYFLQLGTLVTVWGPGLDESRLPKHPRCNCRSEGYMSVPFDSEALSIIASHHADDAELVRRALAARSPYVALIASRKRTIDVLAALEWPLGTVVQAPFFGPAGLDLDARTPDEIALSVIAEVLSLDTAGRAA